MKLRAGGHALSLLSTPLSAQVLEALREGPTSLVDLRRATGSPPATTMRGHMRRLVEIGALERTREPGFPGATTYGLTRSGEELVAVGDELRAWLADAPTGPIETGTPAARSSVKALIDAWSTGIVRVLAARPVSLTELSGLITSTSYPSLERRLSAMRLCGQVRRLEGEASKGTPYAATPWLRRAVVPLVAAVRWERRHLRPFPQVRRTDVESAFLLMASLLRDIGEASGTCRLAVEVGRDAAGPVLAGAVLTVRDGQVAACVTRLSDPADAWASGSVDAWFDAAADGRLEALQIGGDRGLIRDVVDQARSTVVQSLGTV